METLLADNLVEIDNVEFRYDVRAVLKGISMQFPRGRVISVMGLSGCGKTTTLKLIGGQLRPTSGEVRMAGRPVHALDMDGLYALRRRMGMLFQFGALFTDMSVFDNVAFQLREHTGLSERTVRDLVPSELSGGMARRVALARAIALDPMLIMYDEPFAGLDPISLGVIGNLIRRLNDALGATSIVVTHDVQESLKIVDYVYFMSEGVVVAQGTPEQIMESNEDYVRQFVHGQMDGPVPFQYPGAPYRQDLRLEAARG